MSIFEQSVTKFLACAWLVKRFIDAIVFPISIRLLFDFTSMAPEVYLSKSYNETVDTYSFSILCWQILAIDTPYDHIKTNSMFEKTVIRGGVRPKVREEWGDSICKMLREGFVDNPNRPSMADTCERLRREINRLSDEEIDEYLDESRRSRLSNADNSNEMAG